MTNYQINNNLCCSTCRWIRRRKEERQQRRKRKNNKRWECSCLQVKLKSWVSEYCFLCEFEHRIAHPIFVQFLWMRRMYEWNIQMRSILSSGTLICASVTHHLVWLMEVFNVRARGWKQKTNTCTSYLSTRPRSAFSSRSIDILYFEALACIRTRWENRERWEWTRVESQHSETNLFSLLQNILPRSRYSVEFGLRSPNIDISRSRSNSISELVLWMKTPFW